MLKTQINYGSEHEDICLFKIGETIKDYSVFNCFVRLDKEPFLEFIKSLNLNFTELKRTDINEDLNNLKGYKETYQAITLISNDFAVTYNIEAEDTTDYIYDEIEGSLVVENNEHDEEEEENELNNSVCDITFYYNKKSEHIIETFRNAGIIDENLFVSEKKNEFYTIGVNQRGFLLNAHDTLVLEDMNIALHYGDKFEKEFEIILKNLTNLTHGLFLLHGAPGTGKTMLIKYLINKLAGVKKIIYVPSHMIQELANPEFISFIQKHKKSILVLEDAEFALQKRENEFGAQAVSNLLNITNGLLNDAIKVQVIASFNMNKNKLDEALLRPGRLLNEWHFDKLSVDECKKLAKELNKDINITEPMTVAEIYNGKSAAIVKTKKKIGFSD